LAKEASHLQTAALAAELNTTIGSEFGERRHALIPPFLAPSGTELGLRRLLGRSDFERNIFLISRFPAGVSDPLSAIFERIRRAAAEHDMTVHLASDSNAEDTLWANVVTYMWGCRYGIALIDDHPAGLNPNVLIEIGSMLMTGRRCAILKDPSAPKMPTDLVGHIYKSVTFRDHEGIERAIHEWLVGDLSLAPCASCRQSASG
jgi:hypothetical protein